MSTRREKAGKFGKTASKAVKFVISRAAKKVFALITVLAVIFSSLGPVFTEVPVARAATTMVVTNGQMNSFGPGAFIPPSSPAINLAKISVTADAALQTLTSVTVNITGTGFDTTDLATLATDATSGVALYRDNGDTVGQFDFNGTDSVAAPALAPTWSGNNVTLTPSAPVALANGSATIFYVAVRTSGTIANNDQIVVTIPANGVVTSGPVTGPAANFVANWVKADTAGAEIQTVEAFEGSATVTVRFNKPVQKKGGGNLAAANFTYTDASGGAKTISSVAHTAGQNMATLTLSGNVAATEVDGTPSTIAAVVVDPNKITDMGGAEVADTAKNFTSSLSITTNVIPAATAGTTYAVGSPLVTFAAQGGTACAGPSYKWSVSAADATLLNSKGFTSLTATAADNTTGKLFGTGAVANTPGSFTFSLNVTDCAGTPATAAKMLTLNIMSSGGGGIPGVVSINPPGGSQGAASMTVTVTGVNTSFTSSSTVEFLSSGTVDTNLTVSSKTSTGGTNLGFNLAIAGGAALGSRDLKITTGSEVAFMPNAFGIFAAAGAGLNLQFPGDAATDIQMPPGFSFTPSDNAAVNSYRITVKSTSNFSGSALWDYTFPKPADVNNSNGSHCSATNCGLGYGAGMFRMITQPTPLAPNTTYYWQVRSYAEAIASVSDAATALDITSVRGFTTVGSITDVQMPNIMHRPVSQLKTGADRILIARVNDNIATSSTTPALSTTLKYCNSSTSCDPAAGSSVNGVYIEAGFWKYTISQAIVDHANSGTNGIRYFITANDGTNTTTFRQPDNNPFTISIAALATTHKLIGATTDQAAACLAGVYVFADGTAFNNIGGTTACAGGTYELASIPPGSYDVVAFKEGYGEKRMQGVFAIPTADSSPAYNFSLNQGFSGGFGGDTANPRVKFTGPMDGMNQIPGGDSNFRIFVAFDKSMSTTSVTTAGNMTVNEVNTATGGLTDITSTKGSWTYYSTNPNLPMVPPENNLAVWSFSGVNNFGDNKTIAVKITSNVMDTAGNSIQSNQPDGSYAFSFTTGSTANFSGFNTATGTFSGGGTFGSGAFMPPHVKGSNPSPGSFDVYRNAKIVVDFSDPMADDGGGYTLANNFKLYTVSGTTETDVTSNAINTVSLDTAKMNATINLKTTYNTYNSAGSFAAGAKYRLKVLGGAKAANGMTIAPPDMVSNPMFTADFNIIDRTSVTDEFDSGAPTVIGSYPNTGDTNVPTTLGAVNVAFSKDMNASTISTSTFYLSVGSTEINGTVEYRAMERQAFFMPKSALSPNTTYTINVTTGVQAMNGTAIATAVARNFTTGAADTSAPAVNFVNADDYYLAITFSKPMNAAAATDSINFTSSVLKPANITLGYGAAGFAAPGTEIVIPASASFNYDGATSTLSIQGYHGDAVTAATLLGKEILVTISGVKDIGGTAIGSANVGRTMIKDSATTKGALGPMAMSGSAFDMGGGFMPTNFSSTTFGFAPPVEVRPFNMMAGKTTIYGIRLPVSSQIPAGGQIVLTFPTGFDVSAAQQDINSPMRNDFNGAMGNGTITFKCLTNVAGGKSCPAAGGATVTGDDAGDTTTKGGLADDGVVINATSRTVTIYLSAATNVEGHDFLTIDISGIKNSTVPKDFNTAGYTIDIKTKSADGATVKESLTSMPFFIQSAGAYTLSGTITATGATAGTAKVYLGSPMTGPMEATSSAFIAGSAVYSFTGLVAGEYMLFTDQTVTLTGGEFAGKSMPERIMVNETADLASGGDDDTILYNFTLPSNTSGGTNVTVSIDGPANEPLDIFAGSPTGFKVKQVTLNGTAGAESFTINLGNGQWFVGVGPQMPKGMMSGPPPAPNYLPPKPIDVGVSGATITENSGTANNGTIEFVLTSSDKTIKGVVKDGSATPKVMANAEVYAYSPNGGFGTHTQADSAGNFTLNVVDGSYIVGSFVQGMPPSKEVPVVVNSDPAKGGHAANYLYIDGAATGIAPATAATTFILKVAKPDYTISGKVTDGTNVVQGASVYAYRNDGPGYTNANTDSSGAYTLYVSAGTWKVGTFLPQYGQLTEQTVTITSSNASNINFSPSQTGTFRSVSGTVTSGGTAVQGAFVKISGNSTFNEAKTGATGTYSFNVPVGTGYVIRAFVPGVGETAPLAAFDVAGADITGKDITIGTTRTITFTFSAAVSEAFIDLFSSTGIGNHIKITNATTGTMTLPDGSYKVRVDVPGMAIGLTDIAATTGDTVYSSTTGIVTVADGNEGLTITLPTLRTITGTVTDGTNNIADAWVEIVNTATGVHFGTMSNSTALGTNFSFQAADGTYFINAMKPGYFREPVELVVNASTAAQTLAMSAATKTISGQILIGVTGAANAFVRAEKQGGGFAGTKADATGVYSIPVSSGIWKIYAVAEGYAETPYASNPIDMTTASTASGKNITLSAAVNLSAPKSKPITPSSGGTLEDSASGVKLTIPANALGSSTSSGNIQSKDTNNVRETGSSKPLKKYDSTNGNYVQAAKEIKATDSSGNAITSLSSDVTVEMTYTKAELANTDSATDSSINTKAEADTLKMAYWDESSSNWVTKPTTITYKNAAGSVITDATTIDTASEFDATVATVVISAATDHFSLYAPVVSTAGVLAAPTGFGAAAASSTQITLTWTAVVGATGYDIYRSSSLTGTYARIGSEPTVSSGATVTYADSGLSVSTAYFYKITSLNNAGETLPSDAVTATTSAAAAVAPSSGGGGGGGDTTAPDAVTNIAATVSAGKVVLTWTKPNNSDIGSYRIYRSTVSGTKGDSLASGVTASTFTDSTVVNGTTYYYTIHAVDNSGNENSSTLQTSALAGTPTAQPTPTPTPTPSPAAPATPAVPGVSPATPASPSGVTLYRAEGDHRVYAIKDNKKTWIKTAEEFNAKGYKWTDIAVTSSAAIASFPDDTAAATILKVKVVGTPILRVRKSNNTKSAVVGNAKKNAIFTVLEQSAGWYKIQISNGTIGWISGAYASLAEENSATPSAASGATIAITASSLRIRSANGAFGKVLGSVRKGEKYSVLEEKAGWYKIKTAKGITGWVSGEYAAKQ